MRPRPALPTLLAAAALLAGCAAPAVHETQAAFVGARAAGPAELSAAAAAAGWELEQSLEYAPESGAARVVEHRLRRADGGGHALVRLAAGLPGGTPVTVDVEERVAGGSMFALLDRLRAAFGAPPRRAPAGAVACLDHDPPHVVTGGDPDAARAGLAADHGCTRFVPGAPAAR